MAEPQLPFFVDGLRVGIVTDVEHHPGFSRGRLQIDAAADAGLTSSDLPEKWITPVLRTISDAGTVGMMPVVSCET